jgi:hypothetical protein
MAMQRRGVFLIEAVLAIFVLALVGFGLLGALPVQRRFEQQGVRQERLWKLCLAQGEEHRCKVLKLGQQSESLQSEGLSCLVTRTVKPSVEPRRWLLSVKVESQGSQVESYWVVPKQDAP